jgi:hypothetical protein
MHSPGLDRFPEGENYFDFGDARHLGQGAIAGSISTSFGLRKLRQLKSPVPIWGPHHNDVDLDTFEPVDAVHPRTLDRHLAFERLDGRCE